MQGLEDPFARRGGRGQRDSVRVPDLVEVTRRTLLAAERNAAMAKWHVTPEREEWRSDDIDGGSSSSGGRVGSDDWNVGNGVVGV